MARALVVPRNGGSEVLTVEDRPEPAQQEGEVLVDVAAVGVNFIDVYQRGGIYPIPTPFVLGLEGAGTLRETGERVAWAQVSGTGTTVAAIPADRLVPVPDDLDLETAAAAMLQGMTAHYLVKSTFPVKEGDLALVHAAAGGVGQLLVQLVKAQGGTVVATAGSAEKLQIARDLGADHTIDYTDLSTDELANAVRDAAGRGVDVAYDGVGKATFDASLATLRPRGMLVLFGGASGQVPAFDIQRLNAGGSLFLTRPSLPHHIATREELLWRGTEILGALADGSLRLEIGGRYPLADAARAYDDLEARRTTGKLLLIP